MAFQVSPGVLVQERDLTNIIPAVSTSIGAVAGQFGKGPVDEIVSILSKAFPIAVTLTSYEYSCFFNPTIESIHDNHQLALHILL